MTYDDTTSAYGAPAALLRAALMICVAVVSTVLPVRAADGEAADAPDLTPKVHGALRTRAEWAVDEGEWRMQVRNARLSLDGNIAPSISYFLQSDLCDRGKMKILDAWGRIMITHGLGVQAGQFRMPFGTDPFRAPANYVFSNRSYVGKQMCNVRGVGAKAVWTLPLPRAARQGLTLEAGVFNPTSMADHEVWVKTVAAAGKAVWSIDRVKLSGGIQTLEPDSVRINLWGASAIWAVGRWTLEGEYMHKHYCRSAHRPSHAWVVWGQYVLPVKAGVFNRASLEARWDGLTPHSDGWRDSEGRLSATHGRRQRVTVGGTLTYALRSVRCDLRLDYERCFRHSQGTPSIADGDKLLAEMVVRF